MNRERADFEHGRQRRFATKNPERMHDNLRRMIPPGHPMFGVGLWPIGKDIYTNILTVEDGSGRFAVADVDFCSQRETLPHPRIETFATLDKAKEAALNFDGL